MPTIHYVQGQPFLIPDEVTELPTGTQAALPVTQDWYPSGYDNQQALPAQPDMWATIGTAGRKIADLTSPFAIFENIGKAVGANPSTDIPTISEKLSSLVPKNSKAALALKYLTSPERYQLWPEKMVRSGLTLANQARRGEVLTGPGLRREDFTDIPPSQEPQTWIGKKLGLPAVPEQPLDPLIERAQDVAGMQMGTTMFAKPGTASVGSGAFRKGNVEVKPYEYRGEHTAPTPEGGSPLYDVTTNAYPKDFYGPNGLRYYAPGNEGNMDAATYNKIVSMKNKPDELVKIYRAIPWEGKKPLSTLNGNNERSKINPGDWVTISKEYAKEHGEGALNGQYAITMKKVPAKELFTQGDSFHEWGWHPILLSESGKVGAPLSALEKAPMFYSNVENAVKASKQNAASKEQWLSYLKNQPGVKPEELEWTVANLPEGKITKQQLEQHVAENKVQLGENWEPTYGGNKKHYKKWQLLGGDNYRELTLTLPPKGKDIDLGNEAAALAKSLREQYGERWISQAPKEQVAKYENLIDQASAEDTGKHFKSSHWDEPNVLAHVRMNDREIPDVGKSLHIEEIQSDWHQAGRKQGYQLPEKEKLDLKTELENTTNKRIELQKKLKEQAIADPPIPVTKEQKDLLISLQEKEGELGDKYNKLINDGIPNAPFKKTWDELLLKRTINEAVRNGYDAISWTPGEAQAARYDLSKHVNELHYQNRTNTLTALDHNGRTVIDEVVPKEKVSDYIGKEVAEKLFKTEPDKTGQHLLEGEELIIGDKGMKAFYDKMMVDKANALAKKFGGKVETKDLNTNPKGWHIIPPDQNVYGGDTWLVKSKDYNSTGLKFWSKARAEVELEKLIAQEKKQPVHVLKLTPELKKAVSEKGFPLFTGGIPHVPPPEEPTFDERWRDRVPDEMMKRDEIKDLLEQQKIRNLPLDYTPPERKFEGRPVHLTKVNFTPEF